MKESVKQRPMIDLEEMRQTLADLHAREYPGGAPELYERLLPKLPEYIRAIVRRKLDLLVFEDTKDGEGKGVEDHTLLSIGDRTALSMYLNPQVVRAYQDVGRDAVLSNDHHTIEHFEVMIPLLTDDLISVAGSKKAETALEYTGCVFFDTDGTKTIVDCTSHTHAGKYLEAVAKFLCKPTGEIEKWLEARKMKSKAYSVAGDEFVMMLHSGHEPVTQDILNEFRRLVEEEMKIDPELTSYVSFDDEEFVMEYDEWTDAEREQFYADRASMEEKFKASRAKLPERFIPSVSSGAATFMAGIDEAISPDTEEAATLEELGNNAARLMVARADANMKLDKADFRAKMTDEKWKAFLLRNAENRRLENENTEHRKRETERQKRIEAKCREVEELLGELGALMREVRRVPVTITETQRDVRKMLKLIIETPADDVLGEQIVEVAGVLKGWRAGLLAVAA